MDPYYIEPKFYVPEIFGPTIQGEGKFVGSIAHFVRIGGCDYNCSWCDSMHAVEPTLFKKYPLMTSQQVIDAIKAIEYKAEWVILTGGNPAIHRLSKLVSGLQEEGYKVSLETQGSRWNDWIRGVDLVCISPKAPSAGIKAPESGGGGWTPTEWQFHRTRQFIDNLRPEQDFFFKIPCLSKTDVEWAVDFFKWSKLTFPDKKIENFISIVSLPHDKSFDVLERTKKVFGWVQEFGWAKTADIRIFPQQHFLLWGHEKGH
jgi:7-carboxy-7-deazaguanine synthase